MSEWYFLLAPVAVLAVLLLFGFVGCESLPAIAVFVDGPYVETILEEPGLVSYWRLQENNSEEPSAPTVDNTPVSGGTAKDEHGVNNGTYNRVRLYRTHLQIRRTRQGPSLSRKRATWTSSRDPNSSVRVDGGYVEVPFSNSLLLTSFTVEALVHPEWSETETGLYRTVIGFTTSDFFSLASRFTQDQKIRQP